MDYSDRNTVIEAAKIIRDGLQSKPLPQPPANLTPIADAIREGLTAIATSIEIASLHKVKAEDQQKQIADLQTKLEEINSKVTPQTNYVPDFKSFLDQMRDEDIPF